MKKNNNVPPHVNELSVKLYYNHVQRISHWAGYCIPTIATEIVVDKFRNAWIISGRSDDLCNQRIDYGRSDAGGDEFAEAL